ncbi:E1 [Wesgulfec papillomavirus]|nr:E1 [Wesgulfec papillomavirus]
MACFLDLDAICDDDVDGEEEEEEVCEGERMALQMFINDEPESPKTPIRAPFEVTEMLNHEASLTASLEKTRISPEKGPPAKQAKRALFGGTMENGIYTYNMGESESNSVLQTLQESAPLFDSEVTQEEVTSDFSALAMDGILRKHFFGFSCTLEKQKKGEGARFNDLAKSMKSDKTMQKNWMIFCERPQTGLRAGPYRSHVALEAVICQDADNVRAKHDERHALYVIEYNDKMRSTKGVQRLLHSVGVKHALIGVPFTRKPLTRSWITMFTDTLDETKDLTWLSVECNSTNTSFSPEEMLKWCEQECPQNLDCFIALYRRAARAGDENAMAWIDMTSALNAAKQCFALWKATLKGESLQLSLSDYIDKRVSENEGGDAKQVRRLLLFNGVLEVHMLNALRKWLRGSVKKNFLVLHGPGGSGKSMFAEALTLFLEGAMLCIDEQNSFWKSGAVSKRFVMIDDITMRHWRYLDRNERRVLDGGVVAVNKKFSDAAEMKFPPIIATTNYVLTDSGDEFSFLCNRITWIPFPKPIPIRTDGSTAIVVTTADIAAWFLENKETLDLE